ncbi:glycosyltransferase family 4 protein [Shewanella sp.]|jgi:glycosyltransferase involved in cell wall biosynthesis|uniref:glycosyltransferase family 4 protein n=1 Tax=Shewanella sp. TaxID=50422 RepID=UPI0040470D86
MASRNRDTSKLLNLVGADEPRIGYGKIVEGLRKALSKQVTLDEQAESVVYVTTPNMVKGWYQGQKVSFITMWETNQLPSKIKDFLPYVDTVIVPSMHNFDLFSQFHNNVHMMPLGVNRRVWWTSDAKPEGKFRILCGGSEWHRKGLGVVLEVFQKLELPDAELCIKIVPPYLYAPDLTDIPNVTVYDKWMTETDEADLVRSCDLFVSASRGEGFGLMPLQAISAGVPVVLTNAHGHREFADLATHRISTTSVPCENGFWDGAGDWDEPNRDELAAAILDVYENRGKYRRQAALTSFAVGAFNWHTAADQLLQIVKPTSNTRSNVWVDLEPTCEIEVTKRVQADIGKHRVELLPGVKHRVVLNVRDVLKASGVLV